jgi:hypothetical protein
MAQKPKIKKPRITRATRYSEFIALVPAEEIETVWQHWISTFKKTKKADLTDLRRAHIAWAIHTYGVQKSLDAITGCSKSEFHMGSNPAEKTYNDVALIFRDEKHVTRFLRENAK